jgi:hypothetical protein
MFEISKVQKILKIPETGIIDEFTEAAIRNFQLRNSLFATGELDSDTLVALGFTDVPNFIEKPKKEEIPVPIENPLIDTDQFSEIPIKKYFLPKGEFLPGPTNKKSIFLHHTAGYNNPYAIVDMWAKDPQGPIGTQYVIGGPHPATGDERYDGEIVQCFDDKNYAWHLGIGNTDVHRSSIGIELCNFGWVTPGGYQDLRMRKWVAKNPNSFYTYTGLEIQKEQVVDLGFEFRGYKYFHGYSEQQIQSLQFLIKFVGEKLGINIYSGIYKRLKNGDHPLKAFGYWSDAKYGRVEGMFCHSNVVEFGKWDLAPQPKLIEMILSL